MDTLLHDLRFAARTLLKKPAFSVAAALCLALGIGANTAMFSVVNGVLLRPLPYPEPERLVAVWERSVEHSEERNVVAPANYLDWRAGSTVFEEMGVAMEYSFNLTGLGEPEEVPAQLISASMFPVLGVRPAFGRALTAADDAPGTEDVVVLSHGFWQRHFAGDRGVIGRRVMLNGQPFTVVGVMAEGFGIRASEAQLWAAIGLDPSVNYRESAGRFLTAYGRLKPGVTPERAQGELRTIAARLEQAHPRYNTGWSVNVFPLYDEVVGEARRPLYVLAGVVAFVLLIACANVANLQLAQAAARSREIAVRAALGAGRWRVARQLLTESLVLAVAAGAAGILLAYWAVSALRAAAPASLPRVQEVGLDGRVLAFSVVLSLLTGVLFGLVPALRAARSDLQETLRAGGRGVSGGGTRTRSALVVAQVALSLVLLVGAGLMLKSFARLINVSPGFNPEQVLTARLSLPSSKYATPAAKRAFQDELLRRVRALPGVRSATAATYLPFTGMAAASSFWIEGRPTPRPGEEPSADIRAVDADFFGTLAVPVRRGTPFSDADARAASTPLVINEAAARRLFPNANPLGERIHMPWGDTLVGEIVAVVGDVKHAGLDSVPEPTLYWPLQKFPSVGTVTLALRTAGDPMALAPALRREAKGIDPDQPLADVKPMLAYLGDSVERRRFNAALLGGFAAVALVLAAVGLYGVMSYTVAQHTRDFGIRIALGADARRVLGGVLRQALALVGVGLLVGVAGALAMTRVLTGLLYDVSATDPAVFAGIALLLTAVAAMASLLPARRATRVDPMVALRDE